MEIMDLSERKRKILSAIIENYIDTAEPVGSKAIAQTTGPVSYTHLLLQPPKGCPFVDRCDEAMKICKLQMPETTVLSSTHLSACWLNELAKRQGE